MTYLQEEMKESAYPNYYVDVEYNRNAGKVKTIINHAVKVIPINCDIIIHSRGEILRQDNLMAIEMKKSSNRTSEKIKDKNRLIALTKITFDDVWSYDGTNLPEHVCGYGLGIYFEINADARQIYLEYYEKGLITDIRRFGFN